MSYRLSQRLKILKACFELASVFQRLNFSCFECFYDNHFLLHFCFRMNWRLISCCWHSGRSENTQLLDASVCVSGLIF